MSDLPTCPHCRTAQARHSARFCRACGTPLPAPAPTAGGEPLSRTRPRWRRRLLVAGAVVTALALAAAGLRTFQATTDPTDPVQNLLDDLATGHGAAVLEHADVDSPLVLDQALEEGYTPPENLRTTEVTYGGPDEDTQRPNRHAATVHLEYDLDGTTHTAHVQVTREDTGWVRDWEISGLGTLLGALTVTSAHLDQVRVAGAELDTAPPSQDGHTAGVPALPGTYTLATTADEELFVGDEALGEVTVAGPSAAPTTTADVSAEDLTVRDDLTAEVADQVETHLGECAQEETLTPPGCPLRLESTPTRSTDDVSWEILEMPEIDLAPSDEEALHGAPLEVETTTPGTAEAEWTYAYTDNEDPETETVDVTVGGTVTVDEDGKPAWTP